MIASVRAVIDPKGITKVGLYAHAPCLIMQGNKLGVKETLEHLFDGKNSFKSRRDIQRRMKRGLKVLCLFHVCWNPETGTEPGKEKRETFAALLKPWEAFWKENASLPIETIFEKYEE